MTRTITSVSELDALPVGTVVRTARGSVATRHEIARGWLIAGFFGPQVLYPDTDLPAVVLHDPSAPVAPVVSDAAVEAAALVLAERWGAPGAQDAYRPDARAALSAALPFLGAAPSATREDVETITIPRPHVPHGPAHLSRDLADADYLRRAARDLEEFYKPFGSNLRATIVALIRDAAVHDHPEDRPMTRVVVSARQAGKTSALATALADAVAERGLPVTITEHAPSATREDVARMVSVDALDALASVVADVEADAWRVTLAFPLTRPATLASWRTDLLDAITPRTDR